MILLGSEGRPGLARLGILVVIERSTNTVFHDHVDALKRPTRTHKMATIRLVGLFLIRPCL
jgi:hypothetical protein